MRRLAGAVATLATVAASAGAQQMWSLAFGPEVAGASGGGFGQITLVGTSMRFQATWSGLSGTTTVAHVHCCTPAPRTGTAGVATMVPSFAGFPTGVMAGAYDATFDMSLPGSWNPAFVTASGGTTAQALATLVDGLNGGTAYFNIHTSTFPGGEIRAFATVVPEPATYALVGGGLLVLGALRARRRGAAV
ncbi:MAG TPA: CHRD domain-containing protein [Gemmatirosa sp.]|nr:CHRD domain-containing protein [Gemmatirosa sp.]